MAIRFDKSFNAEISRRLGNVNKKFVRAKKAGYARVPQKISIREFKQQFSSKYSTRREMRRALSKLEKANVKDLSQVVELSNGGRISQFTAKMIESERIRVYRYLNREKRKAQAQISATATPFERKSLEDINSKIQLVTKAGDMTESRLQSIHEMHTRIFSAKKKESFENGIAEAMKEQIKMSDLSPRERQELIQKIENTDIDTLIKINRNRKEFASILDYYKGRDEYTNVDREMFKMSYRDIYNGFDEWVGEYSE